MTISVTRFVDQDAYNHIGKDSPTLIVSNVVAALLLLSTEEIQIAQNLLLDS